jgi:16S rRNA (uracil1498-N3)-methyltransferase
MQFEIRVSKFATNLKFNEENSNRGHIVPWMSERFYINLPLQPGPVSLEGSEAHHLAGVCRLRPGDQVTLFNGDGQEYPARLTFVARRQVDLEITEHLSPRRELPVPVEVAAPLPKGDRVQFLIEKLTELGVTTFVPLACQHSVIHPREGKLDKLRRYVIEASKQCGRNVLMEVTETVAWSDYCVQARPGYTSILAHPDQSAQIDQRASRVSGGSDDQPPTGFRLAVGPEGGFTQDEVNLAESAGWQKLDLGPRMLRIETAAVVLAAWIASKFPQISS